MSGPAGNERAGDRTLRHVITHYPLAGFVDPPQSELASEQRKSAAVPGSVEYSPTLCAHTTTPDNIGFGFQKGLIVRDGEGGQRERKYENRTVQDREAQRQTVDETEKQSEKDREREQAKASEEHTLSKQPVQRSAGGERRGWGTCAMRRQSCFIMNVNDTRVLQASTLSLTLALHCSLQGCPQCALSMDLSLASDRSNWGFVVMVWFESHPLSCHGGLPAVTLALSATAPFRWVVISAVTEPCLSVLGEREVGVGEVVWNQDLNVSSPGGRKQDGIEGRKVLRPNELVPPPFTSLSKTHSLHLGQGDGGGSMVPNSTSLLSSILCTFSGGLLPVNTDTLCGGASLNKKQSGPCAPTTHDPLTPSTGGRQSGALQGPPLGEPLEKPRL
ncbi:hypothetical protein JZ751_029422 [Albula glossodonta]|uniref:Uncharacterized protein n=1 Tax=Albula glossodonta TaxID=121402 RepID=A0A8T2PHK5_9TELE|nr:hypothetical protein JZ751_029422 [Albula glossodonta]